MNRNILVKSLMISLVLNLFFGMYGLLIVSVYTGINLPFVYVGGDNVLGFQSSQPGPPLIMWMGLAGVIFYELYGGIAYISRINMSNPIGQFILSWIFWWVVVLVIWKVWKVIGRKVG